MKNVLILSNHHLYTYNFRKEIIKKLIDNKFAVTVVLPYGEKVELLKDMGCKYINLPLDRRGTNIVKDLKLILGYHKIIKTIMPDVILTFTLKPNIYGGYVAKLNKVPYITNITGLGSAVENDSFVQRLTLFLGKYSYQSSHCVFFQNEENKEFFRNKRIVLKKSRIIPGSGVNVNQFSVLEYPRSDKIEFAFISRIMREKGIEEYLEAAQVIKRKYPDTVFHVLGFCEEEYEKQLKYMEGKGIILYHGMQDDIQKFIKKTHCTIHPTYYPEGMSNVLLESAACGRPVISTNRSGCKEIIDHGINGYLVEPRNTTELIEKIEDFMRLSYEQKKEMGLKGREKVEKFFNRDIVVNAYIREINEALANNEL